MKDNLFTLVFSSRGVCAMLSRLLLNRCATYAKDILEFLKTGDSADRLYSCKALLELSGKGLGRFQDAAVYNLMLVATNHVVVNYPVHPEVREEAIEALACILPSGRGSKVSLFIPP